jgi:hypothetical protein
MNAVTDHQGLLSQANKFMKENGYDWQRGGIPEDAPVSVRIRMSLVDEGLSKFSGAVGAEEEAARLLEIAKANTAKAREEMTAILAMTAG